MQEMREDRREGGDGNAHPWAVDILISPGYRKVTTATLVLLAFANIASMFPDPRREVAISVIQKVAHVRTRDVVTQMLMWESEGAITWTHGRGDETGRVRWSDAQIELANRTEGANDA